MQNEVEQKVSGLELTKNPKILTIAWVICVLGALFYCYEYLLRIAPAVMITPLMQTFNLHAESFGALISLYYLAYTPMQAIVGVAHDVYGPRRVLTFAVLMCLLGSFLFGIADSILIASIARLLLGFGSAFAFVGALKLASIWLPSNRFAFFVGAVTALGMLGGMFGNVVMSAFVANVGWRESYLIGGVTGILLLALIWLVIKDQPPQSAQSSNAHSASSLSYQHMLKGIVTIMKSPQMWVAGGIGSMLYLSLSVFAELWGNKFVQEVYGFSTVHAATIVSMVYVGWLIGSPLVGWISDRMQARRLPLIICSFAAVSAAALIVYLPQISLLEGCLLFFLFGVFCSAQNICFALGRENAPKEVAGAAVAFINLVVMFGGLVFQPLVGKLLDMLWSGAVQDGIRIYSGHDFRYVMIILPVGCCFAVLLSFLVRETRAKMVGESIIDGQHK
jgi:MFS family permease